MGPEELRQTFDQAAERYHRARPRYPAAVLDRLHELAGVSSPVDVLEIGPATGIATIPLAERGHRITAVELGPELAEVARANTSGLTNVDVVTASFDEWEPVAWGAFDLVVAATSWHWLNPASKYERAHRHLQPGGHLAFWSANHVVPDGGDPFFAEIQPVYDEIGESLPEDRRIPRPGELLDAVAEIEASGSFELIGVEHHDWSISYDAAGYLALLDTFSGHLAMDQWKRDRLYREIRERLATRPDGLLHRHWGCVVHVARCL